MKIGNLKKIRIFGAKDHTAKSSAGEGEIISSGSILIPEDAHKFITLKRFSRKVKSMFFKENSGAATHDPDYISDIRDLEKILLDQSESPLAQPHSDERAVDVLQHDDFQPQLDFPLAQPHSDERAVDVLQHDDFQPLLDFPLGQQPVDDTSAPSDLAPYDVDFESQDVNAHGDSPLSREELLGYKVFSDNEIFYRDSIRKSYEAARLNNHLSEMTKQAKEGFMNRLIAQTIGAYQDRFRDIDETQTVEVLKKPLRSLIDSFDW
ncbi:hypothetical protein BN7_2777 [Wickerhamomyces ciferrii]|uniref:Uncharacterized protein n=1 Tax=Wickerhamomyces ciferrii (strain ATCC 14091 / BCRC 22168 / CBS 111 / JCM 3599 / NBRC 0793 / NRRL Y-1031 F-60-10) TaxID=1206466 RepID=K0KDP2_WICCF|nr:uncharacterized protein BN7_2777 [Wickerhamomyces ciferrii]CCH43230.1 hypothetical protein BN7_2777 [Wickerhamomyces ciferrii]